MAENETPEDKFKRLANKRVNKTLKSIEQIGKLKAHAYKHDGRAERFAKIKEALIEAVNEHIPSEEAPEKKADGFSLD